MDYPETVKIRLETYNALRDFKRKIEEGEVLKLENAGYSFFQLDKASIDIALDNDKLLLEIEKLNKVKTKLEADLRTCEFETRTIEAKFGAMKAEAFTEWKKQYNVDHLNN
jgi:methionine synthase II (cobalamin-independent)